MADASAGDLVGPIETDRGAAVLELVERREATGEGPLVALLRGNGISDEEYREFVRSDILDDAYREHFETAVVVSPADQRRVAQILIAPVSGTPVPQVRARHVLISPDPSLQDQAEATDEQWAAAEAEAEEVRGMLEAEDADWNAIADEHSDDTGSGSRGGDLGWSDPENSPYVPEFSAALAELEVGEISEPVRSDFGWHVIQKTGERESPQAEAEDIAAQLEDDPDAFADAGRAVQRGPRVRRRRRRARLGGALPARAGSRRTRSSPSARSARSARSSMPGKRASSSTGSSRRTTARRSRRIGSTRSVPMDSSAGWTRSCATASRPGSIRSTKPPQPPPPDR